MVIVKAMWGSALSSFSGPLQRFHEDLGSAPSARCAELSGRVRV